MLCSKGSPYYYKEENLWKDVNRLVDSLLWEKRERKSRRDVKPKQRKDVVVVFSESMLLYKKSLCGLR